MLTSKAKNDFGRRVLFDKDGLALNLVLTVFTLFTNATREAWFVYVT